MTEADKNRKVASGPFILGLTGSIAMGKSTTVDMFRRHGVPVWDADATVENLYNKGGCAVEMIAGLIPDAVKEGRVDKSVLKEEISKTPDLLSQLEAVVHPLLKHSRDQFIDIHRDADLIVFDIPLLFENHIEIETNAVLVVSASAEVQKQRLLARNTMSEEMTELIISKQMSDAEKRRRADYVIETHHLDKTEKAVINLIDTIRQAHA